MSTYNNTILQLDFFAGPVSINSSPKRRRRSRPIVAPSKQLPFHMGESNQRVCDYFIKKELSLSPEHLLIFGPAAVGKTHLLKHISHLKSDLRVHYFSCARPLSELFVYDSDANLLVIDDLDKFKVNSQELAKALTLLGEQISIVILARNAVKIKAIINTELWNKSLILELKTPSKMELTQYAQKMSQFTLNNRFIDKIVEHTISFGEVDHYLLNLAHYADEIEQVKKMNELIELNTKSKVCVSEVEKAVLDLCRKFSIEKDILFNQGREQSLVRIKHSVYYHLKNVHKFSYVKIAAYFGIDHTTVMYAVKNCKSFLSN